MERQYKDILKSSKLKINEKKFFSNLTETEEILITRELINFMYWFHKNIDFLEEYLRKKRLKLKTDIGLYNSKVITEFWLQEIGKSIEIDTLLENGQTINNIYEYIDSYFLRIKLFLVNTNRDFGMVLRKDFRTEEQSQKIRQILNRNDEKSKRVIKFFHDYNKDIDHISKKDANLIINSN